MTNSALPDREAAVAGDSAAVARAALKTSNYAGMRTGMERIPRIKLE
jgi:hypothetical protein